MILFVDLKISIFTQENFCNVSTLYVESSNGTDLRSKQMYTFSYKVNIIKIGKKTIDEDSIV